MSSTRQLLNQVRQQRQARGWSQDELAIRSGLSRTGISAIEQHRLIPSGAAMLALAEVFGCAVEELFRLQAAGERAEPLWAWEPRASTARYWEAEVQGRAAHLRHDGIWSGDRAEPLSASPPSSLVIATCDPAIGLLAERLSADANLRLLAFTRSSRSALALLKQGLAHVAGLHLSSRSERASRSRGTRAAVSIDSRRALGGRDCPHGPRARKIARPDLETPVALGGPRARIGRAPLPG
jgi:transcriptional regulator with XRE-family HTH domain